MCGMKRPREVLATAPGRGTRVRWTFRPRRALRYFQALVRGHINEFRMPYYRQWLQPEGCQSTTCSASEPEQFSANFEAQWRSRLIVSTPCFRSANRAHHTMSSYPTLTPAIIFADRQGILPCRRRTQQALEDLIRRRGGQRCVERFEPGVGAAATTSRLRCSRALVHPRLVAHMPTSRRRVALVVFLVSEPRSARRIFLTLRFLNAG